MIDSPFLDTEPLVTLFDSHVGVIGVDTMPQYGACRRCRLPHVVISSVEIRYPGTERHIPLCGSCADEIMGVLDQALRGAGV